MESTPAKPASGSGDLLSLLKKKAGLIAVFFLVFLGIGIIRNFLSRQLYRVNLTVDSILIPDTRQPRKPNEIDRTVLENLLLRFDGTGMAAGCLAGAETVPYLPPKPADKAPRAIEVNFLVNDTACAATLASALVSYLDRQPLIHDTYADERRRLTDLRQALADQLNRERDGHQSVIYNMEKESPMEKISAIDFTLKHLDGVEVIVPPVVSPVARSPVNNLVLFSLLGIVLGTLAALVSARIT